MCATRWEGFSSRQFQYFLWGMQHCAWRAMLGGGCSSMFHSAFGRNTIAAPEVAKWNVNHLLLPDDPLMNFLRLTFFWGGCSTFIRVFVVQLDFRLCVLCAPLQQHRNHIFVSRRMSILPCKAATHENPNLPWGDLAVIIAREPASVASNKWLLIKASTDNVHVVCHQPCKSKECDHYPQPHPSCVAEKRRCFNNIISHSYSFWAVIFWLSVSSRIPFTSLSWPSAGIPSPQRPAEADGNLRPCRTRHISLGWVTGLPLVALSFLK